MPQNSLAMQVGCITTPSPFCKNYPPPPIFDHGFTAFIVKEVEVRWLLPHSLTIYLSRSFDWLVLKSKHLPYFEIAQLTISNKVQTQNLSDINNSCNNSSISYPKLILYQSDEQPVYNSISDTHTHSH